MREKLGTERGIVLVQCVNNSQILAWFVYSSERNISDIIFNEYFQQNERQEFL